MALAWKHRKHTVIHFNSWHNWVFISSAGLTGETSTLRLKFCGPSDSKTLPGMTWQRHSSFLLTFHSCFLTETPSANFYMMRWESGKRNPLLFIFSFYFKAETSVAFMVSDYIGVESMYESLETCFDSSGGFYEWNFDCVCLSQPSVFGTITWDALLMEQHVNIHTRPQVKKTSTTWCCSDSACQIRSLLVKPSSYLTLLKSKSNNQVKVL